jgi:hypothetical protein
MGSTKMIRPAWWTIVPKHERDEEKFWIIVTKLRLGAGTVDDIGWLDFRVKYSHSFTNEHMQWFEEVRLLLSLDYYRNKRNYCPDWWNSGNFEGRSVYG